MNSLNDAQMIKKARIPNNLYIRDDIKNLAKFYGSEKNILILG